MRPPHLRGPARALIGIGVVAAFSGCTPPRYVADADREVGGILEQYNDKALSGRENELEKPLPAPPQPEEIAPPKEPGEPTPSKETLKLDLAASLAIAMKENRSFQVQRESLYLAGLGFTLTQFDYGPKFNAAVNYLWGKAEQGPTGTATGGTFGVSQLLPTNGTLSVNSGLARTWTQGQGAGVEDWASNVGMSLSQPLLRNAGYDQYRESLTQGERSMVYAVRDFELFREDFAIAVARQYFSLVSAKKTLKNQEFQRDQTILDFDKTEALRRVDRKRDQDVILAERQKIQALQAFENQKTDYERQVEAYLVQLGLDPKTQIEIIEDEPPYEAVAFDKESIVTVAMHNRLDIQTRRDRLDDSERQFKLLRTTFLPDLNLTASGGLAGTGPTVSEVSPNKWNTSAGLNLNIPLQQIGERNNYRAAEISLDQQHRSWDEFVDSVRTSVQAELRSLQNLEKQIVLDQLSIDSETKNVERLTFLTTNGDVSSRDLFESQQQLLQSKNQLISDKASHFIARLGFFRDLGLLFVGPDGPWGIGAPPQEDAK
jgi:outer membrane protein TolC